MGLSLLIITLWNTARTVCHPNTGIFSISPIPGWNIQVDKKVSNKKKTSKSWVDNLTTYVHQLEFVQKLSLILEQRQDNDYQNVTSDRLYRTKLAIITPYPSHRVYLSLWICVWHWYVGWTNTLLSRTQHI